MKRLELARSEKRKYWIVLGCALLVSLICILHFFIPNKSYRYEGKFVFTPEMGEVENFPLYEDISLPTGVYRVQLDYETDTEMKDLCSVEDEAVYFGALLTNCEHLYSNKHSTDYLMWLFESTDTLDVCFTYVKEGTSTVYGVTLVETDYLWSMLLTVIWSAVLICIGVFYVRDYDGKWGLGVENKTVILGLGLIVLIASTPYLLGGTISGADLGYHLHRIEGVVDGLRSGQFPVRLEPDWLYGHGYANGIFYCNTLLTIPAIFRMLGFGVTSSYNAFAVIMNIATAVIAYYCFYRIFKDKYIGLICSGLYTLSIFRIYKFTITSAVGEGTAVTFMPLVLYGLYRIFTEDTKAKEYKTAWIPVAAGYAGLIQCHVLSCEITAFLTIIICLVCIKKIFAWNTFWELAKGAGSALAMSAWYLVPFLDYYITEDVHIKHVSGRTIQDRGLNLAQLVFNYWTTGTNAVSGTSGMQNSHPMGAGLVLVLAFLAIAVLWYMGKLDKLSVQIRKLAKVSCLFAFLLMLMSLNVFPWDRIQRTGSVAASLVSSLQFPNRFLGWGSTFLVVLAGCFLVYCQLEKNKKAYYIGICVALLGVCTSSVLLLSHLNGEGRHLTLHNDEAFGSGYISGAEYLIEGTDESKLAYSSYVADENIQVLEYEKGSLRAEAYCVNETAAEGYVEFPLLHYKGYRAYGEGQELECIKGENNVVRVVIPAGFDGWLEAKFVSPFYWRVAEAVTYLWWFAVIAYVGGRYIITKRGKEHGRVR